MLAFRCAKTICFFNFSNFSILDPTAYHPSTSTCSFDILIPTVAQYGPFDTPEPLFTSVLCVCCCSHRCRQILIVGEKSWRSAPLRPRNHSTPPTSQGLDGLMDGGIAMNGRMDPSYRHQGRCLVEEGGNVTGWACVAYLLATLPTRRSLSSLTYIDPRAP